jgi:predicted metal-dependent HD superfamily phosphohydrolase
MLATHGLPPPSRWRALWKALGATGDDALYHELIASYNEPHRHYHTTRHLDEMFALLPSVEPLARHAAEVELALLFHDAVYQPLRSDNEERSAKWATMALLAGGAAHEAAARVGALVMATRHDVRPAEGDEEIVVDLDLAILGAPPERFDEYEHEVRAEFAAVPVLLFRQGRRKILESFLGRPRIYHTPPMYRAREEQARENIERSIGKLSR